MLKEDIGRVGGKKKEGRKNFQFPMIVSEYEVAFQLPHACMCVLNDNGREAGSVNSCPGSHCL